jgi:archaellum biogenesis ATPase FlaH
MADYAFTPFIIPHIVALLVNIYLIFLVLSRNPRARVNQYCAMLIFVISEWVFGVIFMASATSPEVAEKWVKILYVGACLIPSFAIIFVLELTRTFSPKVRTMLNSFHIIGLLLYPGLTTTGIREISSIGVYDSIKDSTVFNLYGLWLLGAIIISIFIMGRKFATTKNMVERNQLKYMFVGMVFSGIFGPMFDVVFPMMGLEGGPLGGAATTGMALGFAYAILKYDLFSIEAAVEAEQPKVEQKKRLESGFNYLIKEKGSHTSYEIFRGMVSSVPGLCFTTFHPKKLRAEYVLEKTPIIWLTDTSTQEKNVKPDRLEFEILYNIESFIKDNEKTVVLIDDLKYLTVVNGFDQTMDFIKAVNDISSMHNGTVVIPVNPMLFEEKEMLSMETIFDEMMDAYSPGEEGISDFTKPKNAYSYLIESENLDNLYNIVKSWGMNTMVLTKTYPDKVSKKYEMTNENMYWLTDTQAESSNTLNPHRLEFEITMKIGEFLRKEKGVVAIDCMDLMIMNNDINQVNEFMKSIVDIASVEDCIIIATLNPKLYKETEVGLFRKRFDIIQEK